MQEVNIKSTIAILNKKSYNNDIVLFALIKISVNRDAGVA